MKKAKTLSIALSSEELSITLRYLKTDRLVGLEPDSALDGLGKDGESAVLRTAEKALMARGFLLVGKDGKLELTAPVFATVGTCAFPESSLLITKTTFQNYQQALYFHSYRKMLVTHTVPLTGIHQFTVFEDREDVINVVDAFLQLGRAKHKEFVPGDLALGAFLEARRIAIEAGAKEAQQILETSNLAEETAVAFSQTLAKPIITINLSYVAKSGEVTKGFTVLQDQDVLWLISPSNSDDQHIDLMTTSCEQIQERAKDFVNF